MSKRSPAPLGEIAAKNQEANRAKQQAHFRLTDQAHASIDALAAKLGVNKTAVIELAIRKMAEQEKV